ncbi:MAG TPA: N-acetylmuramoyl-L-alanine amidase [Frankiaceae bacterium]|nr:N-acetylmuramoyl-L-alanine amidase [Frankiaceae bacterium]
MQLYRLGSRGPAVRHLRAQLADLGLLGQPEGPARDGEVLELDLFDDIVDEAVRSFQQSRGLRVDGIVGIDTTRALDEAARSLGDRLLYHSVSHPFVGDDVLELQSRLADMGFDVGRVDGIFGDRTEGALREFQRNRGLASDGACGPVTLRELTRLQRTVVGGRPYELREAEQLRRRGPSLAGKTVVIDPGHGGEDPGWEVDGVSERDLMHDLACQLEGRLLAVGVNAFLTHHPRENPSDEQRSAMANETDADLLVSLHTEGASSPRSQGVATYYFGTGRTSSVVGERFAELVHREIVARTDLVDCRTHSKSWDMLRRTRMPAVRLELGYLTNDHDARALASRDFRATVAEGILAAVQRIFLPPDLDPPTGQWRLPESLRS